MSCTLQLAPLIQRVVVKNKDCPSPLKSLIYHPSFQLESWPFDGTWYEYCLLSQEIRETTSLKARLQPGDDIQACPAFSSGTVSQILKYSIFRLSGAFVDPRSHMRLLALFVRATIIRESCQANEALLGCWENYRGPSPSPIWVEFKTSTGVSTWGRCQTGDPSLFFPVH